MTEPKPTHRFVPTLTEVVQPPPAMHAPEPLPITPEVLEGIVDAALKRVEAGLTQKLPELMAVLLHEQALAISERLRREIRSTVRESVQATGAGDSGASPRSHIRRRHSQCGAARFGHDLNKCNFGYSKAPYLGHPSVFPMAQAWKLRYVHGR
jgi:hypothetical protein